MNQPPYNNTQLYGSLPSDAEGMEVLTELALDLRWSWNHSSDELWKELEPNLWELTHNPWIILQTVSRDHLERKLEEPAFKEKMQALQTQKNKLNATPAWFQQNHPNAPVTCIAYFSMEFMLSEALPIYVGGLGNVAGDQLKSASDLGVPVAAIGLLYQQGYFRQQIDKDGNQVARFPYNDPGQLPITPLRLANGEWLRLQVNVDGYVVCVRTWQVQVGRVKLYLLDTNDMVNLPQHREITSELYGGGAEMRIKQEIILGMGGWKLLDALGIHPEVCHMNEGHAAFVILERARHCMQQNGLSFEAALAVTRAGNLFTTHTAVAAGFDHFSPGLMYEYLGEYAQKELKIDFNELMALGRLNPHNTSEKFNMAYLAIRGSGAVNGVSQLHGEVSRRLFSILFPRQPLNNVPVGYVTNGVHMPSWDGVYADKVWTDASGKERWKGGLETMEEDINKLPAEELWKMRCESRNQLVAYARKRFVIESRVAGHTPEMIATAGKIFNADTLTLGFARRFVPYKRPNLLLQDPERLIRILTNPVRPVQLVIAGKAPPFDDAGKSLIRQWVQFIAQNNLYHHCVFLGDYDVLLTEHMVQGADVWLNTPRRPWEACGTSGMKVLVNGGINLSELDGWWAEAYTPEVGWALGDMQERGDDPDWDALEAENLYDLLEKQVVPEFYDRNDKGIPEQWIERMRKSMSILTPRFSANRAVRQYTENYYLPAAGRYAERAAGKGVMGNRIVAIQQDLRNKWPQVQFADVTFETVEGGYHFKVGVQLQGVFPNQVMVQLYANGLNGQPDEQVTMQLPPVAPENGVYIYQTTIATERPATDYTARLLPAYEGVSVPLEDNLVLWQQ